MRHKDLLSAFLVILFLPYTLLCGQGVVVHKNILVEEGEVQENIIALGGEVIIQGKVTESVLAFGGKILVEGEVGEAVVGIGSKIILKPSALIKGDVVSIGGTLEKESGATIKGDTIFFELKSLGNVFSFLSGMGLGAIIPFLIIIKLIILFLWFILAVILSVLFPKQIAFSSSQIRKAFWPIFATGLLAIVIFVGLIIFSALLSLLIIGIPILVALIFLGLIIKVFGQVVLYHFFGESLSRSLTGRQPSIVVAVIIGLLIIGLIGFVPLLGPLFSFVLSIIGWGVVVRTKFGTSEDIFKRKG